VFGAAVLVASWRMDRLESLNINPWSAPGLARGDAEIEPTRASGSRVSLAVLLCFGYAAGLLGHGLPFWLTSAAFMFVAILAFRWLDRDGDYPSLAQLAASSAAIALGAALAIGLLFEQVFLVRLP
jgi:putative tricarboxylic transport membrane protein